MAVAASIPLEEQSVPARMAPPSRFGDKAFEWLTLGMALVVILLVFLIGWQLARGSELAVKRFGFHFLGTSTWDPVAEQFGALPFIYGTIVSSLIALVIAVPLSIATAIFLTILLNFFWPSFFARGVRNEMKLNSAFRTPHCHVPCSQDVLYFFWSAVIASILMPIDVSFDVAT